MSGRLFRGGYRNGCCHERHSTIGCSIYDSTDSLPRKMTPFSTILPDLAEPGSGWCLWAGHHVRRRRVCDISRAVDNMLRNDSNLLIVWEPYLPALTIVSCAFSVIGSVSFMASYCVWKDTRSISRLILVIIALSDLVTASGYIIGSALYLNISSAATENGTDYLQLQDTQPFQTLCMIQSTITTISNMWSFWWMVILAIHLCLSAGYMKKELSQKLLPFAALLATCVPVVVTIPAAVTGWLGPGNGTASVSWCFIGLPDNHTRDATYDALEFVEGKMWEFASFALILVLVSFLKCRLNKHVSPCLFSPPCALRCLLIHSLWSLCHATIQP